MVPWMGADHCGPIGGEEMPNQKSLFFKREVCCWSLSMFEEEIAYRSSFDLL